MDTKAYISSGILEQYALGSVSDQERQEVECMSHIYPEIRLELDKLQGSLESFAKANAVEPSAGLKSRIMDSIDGMAQEAQLSANEENDNKTQSFTQAKAPAIEAKVIPMYVKLAVAASVVLAIAFGGLWVQSNSESNAFKSELAEVNQSKVELTAEMDAIIKELESASLSLEEKESLNTFFTNDNTQTVHLAGTDASPDSEINVYWNSQTKAVVMKLDELPQPATDKQYQLWAIVDGKPTDMGVFDFDEAVAQIQEMPYEVANAQAFAITLENKGGSIEPTLTAMVAYGAVSS